MMDSYCRCRRRRYMQKSTSHDTRLLPNVSSGTVVFVLCAAAAAALNQFLTSHDNDHTSPAPIHRPMMTEE